jgi:hypothetical protein
MKNRVFGLAVLAVATALTTAAAAMAAPAPSKPQTGKPLAVASPAVTMPLPDITMRVETDGTIAIQNIGDVSVPKPFGVDLQCKVKTATVRGQKCGGPFDATGRWFPVLTLPPGTKEAPLKESPGQVTFIKYGPGWAMLYPAVPSWPKGVYTISGCANPNPADPAKVVREKTKNNNCSFADVTRQ